MCDIIEEVDIEQSNLSQHLGTMKKQGIIDSRKDGPKVIYRIVYASVMDVVSAAEKTLSEQIGHSQSILKYVVSRGSQSIMNVSLYSVNLYF